VAALTGQHLIAVQTVMVESYWRELAVGLHARSLDVFHVLLHADAGVLAERIKADETEPRACQWRLDHLAEYATARPWMAAAADLVVDSTELTAAEVVQTVAEAIQPVLSPAPDATPARTGGAIGA
jgi:hypothetical protein